MRILQCIPTLGGGGAERQLAYLLPLLARRGWDVHLVYLHDGPNRQMLQNTPVRLHQPVPRSSWNPRTAVHLYRYIRQLRPDIVHTWLLFMDVVAGMSCRRLGIPWVMSERSAGPVRHSRWYRNLPRKWVGSHATAIVSNSPAGDNYWAGVISGKTQRYVIPNCLPAERFANVKEPVFLDGISPSRKVVLYVGRLDVEKNPETLVAVLQRVLAARSDVDAVLCGDGASLLSVRAALKQGPHADRTHILGYTPDAMSWIRRASVVLNPSHVEGHPNAVLETAAIGTPLVLSDISSHRHLFTAESALFAATTDPDDWTQKILATLDHPEDAHQRAEQARKIVSHLTPEAMADAYDHVYRNVLGCLA